MQPITDFFISQPILFLFIGTALVFYWVYTLGNKTSQRIPVGLFILYFAVVHSNVALDYYFGIKDWHKQLDTISDIVLFCAFTKFGFFLIFDVWLKKFRKKEIPNITRDVALTVIFVIITIIFLHQSGDLDVLSIVTTSAVLTMVIGLAMQDTLGNLFSGLSLQTEKVLQQDEWISFQQHVGKIVGMTWRSTLIKTRENEIIIVPNTVLSKEIVKNYSRLDNLHIAAFNIKLERNIAPNQVRKVIFSVLEEHPKVLKEPYPQVRLLTFDESATNYQVRFWNNDFENELLLISEIHIMLWYALKRNGITIPYPVRDLRMHHIELVEHKRELEESRVETIAILRNIPVFEPLSDEEINVLASGIKYDFYGNGEIIVRQGNIGDSMFIINDGKCVVFLKDHDEPVATLTKGDFFGEMSLLTGQSRNATVKASGDVAVIEIRKNSISKILNLRHDILEKLGEVLAQRQAANEQLQDKLQKQVLPHKTHFVMLIKTFFNI